MTDKFTTKLTASGQSLVASLIGATQSALVFAQPLASQTSYADSQLATLDATNLAAASHDQTGQVASVQVTGNTAYLTLVFRGSEVKSDYTLNTIFLSANGVLFAVIKANQPLTMNAATGSSQTDLQINTSFTVTNADLSKVTVKLEQPGLATSSQLDGLKAQQDATNQKVTDIISGTQAVGQATKATSATQIDGLFTVANELVKGDTSQWKTITQTFTDLTPITAITPGNYTVKVELQGSSGTVYVHFVTYDSNQKQINDEVSGTNAPTKWSNDFTIGSNVAFFKLMLGTYTYNSIQYRGASVSSGSGATATSWASAFNEIYAKNTAVDDVRSATVSNASAISSLQTKANDNASAIGDLKTKTADNTTAIDELKNRAISTGTTSAADISELKTKTTDNSAKISELQTKTSANASAISDLKAKDVATNTADISSLKAQQKTTSQQVADIISGTKVVGQAVKATSATQIDGLLDLSTELVEGDTSEWQTITELYTYLTPVTAIKAGKYTFKVEFKGTTASVWPHIFLYDSNKNQIKDLMYSTTTASTWTQEADIPDGVAYFRFALAAFTYNTIQYRGASVVNTSSANNSGDWKSAFNATYAKTDAVNAVKSTAAANATAISSLQSKHDSDISSLKTAITALQLGSLRVLTSSDNLNDVPSGITFSFKGNSPQNHPTSGADSGFFFTARNSSEVFQFSLMFYQNNRYGSAVRTYSNGSWSSWDFRVINTTEGFW